jgi:hypothetical protein
VLGALAVVALGVGAVLYLGHSLDGLVADAIERVGSELTGSAVTVQRVQVRLRDADARVEGLDVANPAGPAPGYSKEPALALGEIQVAIDTEAFDRSAVMAGDAPIPLKLVRVGEFRVNAEATPAGLNLERLRQNVQRASPSAEAQPHTRSGDTVRLRIERFEFVGGRLRADATQVGGRAEELSIPTFALHDLGGAEGADPAEIGQVVLRELLSRSIRAAAKAGLSGEMGKLKEQAREKLQDLFD